MVKLNTREVCFPLPTQSTLPCAPQMPSDPQLDSAKGVRAAGGVRRGREGFRVLLPRFLLQLAASPAPRTSHAPLQLPAQLGRCSHAVQAPESHPLSEPPFSQYLFATLPRVPSANRGTLCFPHTWPQCLSGIPGGLSFNVGDVMTL